METRRNMIPMLDWLRTYQKGWLPFDLLAGLTTAAVVIPKAMAYAAIAGLPLVVGLYTSLVMLLIYAVMGTSRQLSVTTSSTIAILAAGALGEVAPGGDAAALLSASATLSLLVGAFLFVGGLLRLGVVANLISDPVLTGFKAGVGIIIVLDQVPKLLGIHIAKAGFFRDIASIMKHLPETSLPTFLLAAAMLGLMFGLEHFTPRLPAPLITVAIGIALAAFFGIERFGISLVGTVQAGLPSFTAPELALAQQLWPAALGIALMSFVETAAAGRAFVHHGDPLPDANRELVATGLGNLVGSFFHIMPGGGGTSQTAVNDGAGARSQIAAIVTAAVVAATLLFLAPLFGLMPHAVLAAVVIAASVGLVSPAEFRAILQVRAMEFRWALFSMIGVLLLGTLQGILVAVLVSLLGLIIRANLHPLLVLGRKPGTNVFRPLSAEHPEDETFPGLLLLRPEGAIYFGNAYRLGRLLRTAVDKYTPKVLALDLGAVPDLEYTALKMMIDGEEKLRETGTLLWLVAMNPYVLDTIRHSALDSRLGRAGMFFNLDQAVAAYQKQYGAAPTESAGRT